MSVVTITTRTDRQASGVAGVTRRGSHAGEHGRPCAMPVLRATDGYKETKFHQVAYGSRSCPYYRSHPEDNITSGEGRGNAFITFLKKGRKRRLQQC